MVHGLKPGGVTVIVGAGAMGRMNADVALNYKPQFLVVVDMVEERLGIVKRLFGPRANKAGITLQTINPAKADLQDFVNELTAFRGADDVIVAVGSRKAIEGAQFLLGRGGVLDLFGGLKKGEDTIGLNTSIVHYQEINVTGSSGGSPWDIARTLDLLASGEIDASSHITRIGDLEHTIEILRMVMAQKIDGKAVVYPNRRTAEILAVKSWGARDEREFLEQGVG